MTRDGKSDDWKSDAGTPGPGSRGASEDAGAIAGAVPGAADAPDPIALGLRKLWADVENEEVPDEFLALLDLIDDRLDSDSEETDTGGTKTGGSKTGSAKTAGGETA